MGFLGFKMFCRFWGCFEVGNEGLRKWAILQEGFSLEGLIIRSSLCSIRVSSSDESAILDLCQKEKECLSAMFFTQIFRGGNESSRNKDK